MKRKTKFMAIMLVFALIMSSFNGFSVLAETTTVSGSSVKSPTSYASRIVKIYVDGKAYAKGDTVEASSFDSEEKPDVNITSVVLDDGTVLESSGSSLFGEIDIRYQMLSYSKNGGMVTSVYQMCIYDHDSYTSCVQFLKVKLTRKSNADDEEEEVDNSLNKKLDPYDKLETTIINIHYYDDSAKSFPEDNLKLLLKNKNDRKNASFKSLNKKLFKVKNNKKIVYNERKGVWGYKYGAGYLQVNVNGKKIGKILVVIFPDEGYHDEFYPRATKIKRIGKNKVKLKLFYPKKKWNVTNIKGFKFNYIMKTYNDYYRGDKAIKTKDQINKTINVNLNKNKTDIFLEWGTNFKMYKNSYIHASDDITSGWSVITLKSSKIKKMKKNKWYTKKRLDKLGIIK